MAHYATRDCDCTAPRGLGYPRPDHCEAHGNRFLTDAELNPSERKPERRPTGPERDWADARSKIDEEGCCRICKRSDVPLEAAHVLGREHDEPKIGVGGGQLKVLYVRPDRVFPACGPFPNGCHGDAEYRRINVLPFLTIEEQVRAVLDAGGIAPAHMRLAPVTHREEVERTAA